MNWYLEVLKKYAVFNGRATRMELWMFSLFNGIIAFGLAIVDGLVGSGGALIMLYYLAIIIPVLAVSIRRLHDTGRSGWWYLIGCVPLIGGIVLLIFFVEDSQRGENQYGASSKYPLHFK